MTAIPPERLLQPFIVRSPAHVPRQGTLLLAAMRAIGYTVARGFAKLRHGVACTGLMAMAVLPATVAEAQGGLAARWDQARDAARRNGWSTYWVGYAVRPAAGTRVPASNGPAADDTSASAWTPAGGGSAALSLGGPPAPTDAVFLLRMVAGRDEPQEMRIRPADAPAGTSGVPVAWLGVAPAAEGLALLERVRASAPERVRAEVGPAAAMHGDARRVVAFVRRLLAGESSERVRAQTAFWLQYQRTAESLALLEEMVRRDASPRVREEAVTAIAQMGTPEGRAVLLRLSGDAAVAPAARREAMDWFERGRGRR